MLERDSFSARSCSARLLIQSALTHLSRAQHDACSTGTRTAFQSCSCSPTPRGIRRDTHAGKKKPETPPCCSRTRSTSTHNMAKPNRKADHAVDWPIANLKKHPKQADMFADPTEHEVKELAESMKDSVAAAIRKGLKPPEAIKSVKAPKKFRDLGGPRRSPPARRTVRASHHVAGAAIRSPREDPPGHSRCSRDRSRPD